MNYIPGQESSLNRNTGGGHRPEAPMREQPSDDMIDERLAAWQAGDYPEGWSVYDALGWSRNEYMTWLNDPSRVPERPCRPCRILKFTLPWRGMKRELSRRNLLNASTSMSAIAPLARA